MVSCVRDVGLSPADRAFGAQRVSVGRTVRSVGRTVGAALRAAIGAGLRGGLKRIDSDVHRSGAIIAGCDHLGEATAPCNHFR